MTTTRVAAALQHTIPRTGHHVSRRRRRRREGKAAYLFLIPWFLGMVLLVLGPMIASLVLSFTNYDFLQAPQFIGIRNYVQMFTQDPRFWTSVRVTTTYIVLSVPLQLLFALGLAVLLNRSIRGAGLYRAIFYLPSLLGGSVAIAILWQQIFGRSGLLNTILATFGVHTNTSLVDNPNTALYTIVLLNAWTFGSPMIIFLAGLRQIPQSLYEAAAIDGAGRLRKHLSVTLPLLTPIVFFNIVLQTINAFQSFTPAYVISGGQGGPADSTLFYTLYLYLQGFGNFKMGYASAMAWVLLLVIAAVTGVLFYTSRFWVFYGDEEGR